MTSNTNTPFFISHSSSDIDIAREVDTILKAGGLETIRQEDRFGNQNFYEAINNALESGARVISLFSEAYFRSDYCRAEAYAALSGDPLNKEQRLIPVRIDNCSPPGLLANIAFVDLAALKPRGDALRDIILDVVQPNARQLTREGHGLWVAPRTILHPEIEPVPNFTARAGELSQLKNILFSGQAAAVTATISAMGGVGKTVLARQYGWEHRDDYTGVWWMLAESRESIVSGLVQLGAKLVPNIGSIEDRNEAAQLTLQTISDAGFAKPWLLIYDNIEDPSALKGLTPKDGAHVLVTSRWKDWSGYAQVLDLELFSDDEAVQFLLDRTNSTDEDGAKQLAELLGNLPLALEQAAAYCQHGVSFADYIASYNEMLQAPPKQGSQYPDSVWATFSLAMKRVRDGNKGRAPCPEADKLLNIAAYLAPDDIPLEVFPKEYIAPVERVMAINALADVSLIKIVVLPNGAPAFSMHRLVQDVVRNKVEQEEEAQGLVELAVTFIYDSFPEQPDDVRYWQDVKTLETHVRTVLTQAPETGDAYSKTADLLHRYGMYLWARSDYTEAEPLYRRALSIWNNNIGPDSSKAVSSLIGLATIFHETNRMDEAEPLYHQSLKIWEGNFGPDHPQVCYPLVALANLLMATNRKDEAEPLYRRALSIRENALGSNDPIVAHSLACLANFLLDTNRVEEAEPLHRRALKIWENTKGENHPDVAYSLTCLATLLAGSKREDEAEPLYRRALKIREDTQGPEHPDVAWALNGLGALFAETNRRTEAEPLYRRALLIWETVLGPNHPQVAYPLANLAEIYQNCDRKEEAETLYRRAIKIWQDSLGPDHPLTIKLQKDLEALLFSEEKVDTESQE